MYRQQERDQLLTHLELLEKEYEELRRQYQPLMMDSLLETINSLKQIQKNYETEVELYAFDYKAFFDRTVAGREKVYRLYHFLKKEEDTDDSEDEDSDKDETESRS